jgi:hypothetical protein
VLANSSITGRHPSTRETAATLAALERFQNKKKKIFFFLSRFSGSCYKEKTTTTNTAPLFFVVVVVRASHTLFANLTT